MSDTCKLREANGEPGRGCDADECIYWRVVDHLGGPAVPGCAIQYYELLGDDGVAAWLLSVKERVEAESAGGSR